MKRKPYPAYKPSGVEWIGEIPEKWEMSKTKWVSSIKNSNVDKKTEKGEKSILLCNYVDVYKNDLIDGSMDFMEASATAEEINKFILRENDVIITKDSEDWSDIAIPAYVTKDFSNVICGYHLALLRSKPNTLYGKYLFRQLQSKPINTQFMVSANGITRFGLGLSAISSTYIILPPLPEQQAIASFLDRETGKIDTLIGKNQRLIELLKEKRIALIARAVTKGLDPTVKTKPSGVEWLGDVPEHWEVQAIKWHSPVLRGASPRPIDDPVYFDEDGEYAWVRIADVTSSSVYLQDSAQRLSDVGSNLSVKLNPGSLFLSIAATVGVPCITNIKCCIHDGFVYFPRLKADTKFMYYIFACGEPYKGLGKLGTQLNLNTDTVGSIVMGFPPLPEQQAIADFLDKETGKIDALITKVEKAIEKLKEYRTALISAAVTGKIDVREAA